MGNEESEYGKNFEKVFTKFFNRYCTTYKIAKFGIERTNLRNLVSGWRKPATDLLGYNDQVSKFLRHLPDAVLIPCPEREEPSHLVEFKCRTPNSFPGNIESKSPSKAPIEGNNVLGIKSRALDSYSKLQKICIPVLVIGYSIHIGNEPLRVAYAKDINNCDYRKHNITNTDFSKYHPLINFFSEKFSIPKDALRRIENDVIEAMRAIPQQND